MESRNLLRWGGVTLGALAAITLIATTAMPRDPDAPPQVTVEISDAGTGPSSDCSADTYANSFFDGATVTLGGGADASIAEATVSGAGSTSQRGCSWTVTFPDVPVTEEYTVTLRSAGSPPREHVYRYTATDLAEREGNLWISVVA